jgi:hypothetical protein
MRLNDVARAALNLALVTPPKREGSDIAGPLLKLQSGWLVDLRALGKFPPPTIGRHEIPAIEKPLI